MSQQSFGSTGGGARTCAFVRAAHWMNAIAMTGMIGSGWRIYNASPFFDFRFPPWLTVGEWLAGALACHFAAMWLLVSMAPTI